MTIQGMKNKLIEKFNAKQFNIIANYKKKVAGMGSHQTNQEYDLIVLGKVYKAEKPITYKKPKKTERKVKAEATKKDVKEMW